MPTTLSPAIQKVLAVRVSGMFAAILDYALDNPEKRVSPEVTALSITSDGFLMGWNTSRPDKEGFMGAASDLDKNIQGVCACVSLTPEETSEVTKAIYAKISDWRSASARKGCDPHRR